MTTLGIVGSGNIGGAVARVAVGAGIKVVVANSRGPQSLADVVAELGPLARAGTVAEAAAADGGTLVAIPFWRYSELPPSAFENAVVLDAMNFESGRDAAVAGEVTAETPPPVLLQRHLPGARIVKVFSNIFARHIELLARPAGAADRSALPIAGDDPDAKEAVTELLDRLGWDTVDAGNLAASKRFDLGTAAFVAPDVSDTQGDWLQRLATDPGKPVSADSLRTLL